MRVSTASIVLLLSSLAAADPPPGGTPPAVNCGKRDPLTKGAIEDGRYVGREPIEGFVSTIPEAKGGKWFHEVSLTIADGKVSLAAIPVVYVRGQRHESASEGGFYHFDGCLKVEGDHYSSEMRLMSCD